MKNYSLLLGFLSTALLWASNSQAQEKGKIDSAKPGAKTEFVRVLKGKNDTPLSLQTAIVTYKASTGKHTGAEVALIGAIHIAEKSYYARLNEIFKKYDAILYEMVADPGAMKPKPGQGGGHSPVSSLQMGMKDLLGLSFQLEEIDYQAKNLVHADMNPEEFSESMKSRQEGIFQILMRSMGSGLALQGSGKTNDLDVLSAFFSSNRELALKRALADQFGVMEGQMAALQGDDGKSTLITERNAKALEVLSRELNAGKKKLGIFYGAGHFKHMDEQLRKEYSMQPVETQWLDAWNLK